MRRLFICLIALSIGVCTFTSCTDKEKDDLKDSGKGGREKVDPASVLTISQQQAVFSQTLSGLGNRLEFTNIAQALNAVLAEKQYDLKWETALDALRARDALLGAKLDAIKQILKQDSIYVDFDKLYFEAEMAFKDTVVYDSTYYFRYISNNGIIDVNELDAWNLEYLNSLIKTDTLMIPVLLGIQHNTEQLKIKLNTGDGNNITLSLKGQNDTESRLSVTVNDKTRPVALPSKLAVSLCLNEDTLIRVNADYTTDFKVEVKGTKADEDADFKLSYLTFDGSNLSLNAGVSLDIYSVKAKASYDDDKGLDVDFAANISNEEAVSGNINIRGKVDNSCNWADPANILAWAGNPEYFKGVDCNVNVFKDQIRMKVNIDNPLVNGAFMQLFAFLSQSEPMAVADTTMARLVNDVNKILKAELYFKGYDQPQAIVKLAYEPPTKGSDFSSIISTIKDNVIANFDKLGLKIGIETYDDEGYKNLFSFKEYFGGIDVKSFTDQIKNKFELAFGPMISELVDHMFGNVEKQIDKVISNTDEL